MKTGIIGLAGAGKTTVFEALTQSVQPPGAKGEARLETIHVPDDRVDALSRMYNPQKTTYAQVEYFLPGPASASKNDPGLWVQTRDADALLHVVRNFGGYGLAEPTLERDFHQLDQELIFADLMVVEKRLERLAADDKRGKKADPEEIRYLAEFKNRLEQEIPLRKVEGHDQERFKGFTFLSAKPQLVLINNPDEDETMPDLGRVGEHHECAVIRGKLERELAQMPEEEAAEFLDEFNINALAAHRVIQKTYRVLGLISFFTVGEDEVKAWTVPQGTNALDAADVIHSDIKKGFIRAEVVAHDDLLAAASMAEARKRAQVRLEGKTYVVQDGDVIHFRFNV